MSPDEDKDDPIEDVLNDGEDDAEGADGEAQDPEEGAGPENSDGPPPEGFQYACPECGRWKNKKGVPFTSGALNFHRMNVHGHRKSKDSKWERPKKRAPGEDYTAPAALAPEVDRIPETASPGPEPSPMPRRQPAPPMEQRGDEPAFFDFDEYDNYHRKKRLVSALRANTLLDGKETQYVLNHWELNPALRSDPRAFYDFLMRLPKLSRKPEWANDIVDITFLEEEDEPDRGGHYSPPGYGVGYRPRNRPGYRGSRPRDDYYDPYAPPSRRGRDPYGEDGYYPPGRPALSPYEVEERMRRERYEWQQQEEMRRLKERNEKLQEQIENPPQPQMSPEEIIKKTVEEVTKVLAPKGDSPEVVALRGEMREMRDDARKLREESQSARVEATVRGANAPLEKEIADMRAMMAAKAADERARAETTRFYQSQTPPAHGLSDNATVAVEEIKNQTQLAVQALQNFQQTTNEGLKTLVKLAGKSAPENVQTEGLNPEEKKELDKIAKGG